MCLCVGQLVFIVCREEGGNDSEFHFRFAMEMVNRHTVYSCQTPSLATQYSARSKELLGPALEEGDVKRSTEEELARM